MAESDRRWARQPAAAPLVVAPQAPAAAGVQQPTHAQIGYCEQGLLTWRGWQSLIWRLLALVLHLIAMLGPDAALQQLALLLLPSSALGRAGPTATLSPARLSVAMGGLGVPAQELRLLRFDTSHMCVREASGEPGSSSPGPIQYAAGPQSLNSASGQQPWPGQ